MKSKVKREGLPIKVDGKTYRSVAQASRQTRISDRLYWKWIKKYGNKFKTGDLEVELL